MIKLYALVGPLADLDFLVTTSVEDKDNVMFLRYFSVRIDPDVRVIDIKVNVPRSVHLGGPGSLHNLLDTLLAPGTGAISYTVDDDLRSENGLALLLHGIGPLALVPGRLGKGILPAHMVKERYVVGQKKQVWVVCALENARNDGRTGLAALGLEELDHGEGLKVDETGGCVLVIWVFTHGMALVIKGNGADQRGLLLAAEELSKDGSHVVR
jgi:hypothetical protein